MKILIKQQFKEDAVTREAGEKLRRLIVDTLQAGQKIELDFSDCLIASTSFFDEGIAKLAEEGFEADPRLQSLTITHLHPRDRELLKDLCKRKGLTSLFPYSQGAGSKLPKKPLRKKR